MTKTHNRTELHAETNEVDDTGLELGHDVTETAPAQGADAPAAATAEASAAKDRKSRPPRNIPLDAVVHLGKDANGLHYGPANNPKKPGSQTHGRFQLYRDGATVGQLLEAGVTSTDIEHDRRKEFIVISIEDPAQVAA